MNLPTQPLQKIQLTQTQRTLLMTLHAKAVDSRLADSILHDSAADEILRAIDLDVTQLNEWGNNNLIVVRARQYDEWLKRFLGTNADAVVVNLGCGLDTRITRVNPSSAVSWFDVDYPEVIRLRENFFSNREGYKMIASSITDPQWLTQVPADRPVMIVADGVLEYLTEADVRVLLNRLTHHFPRGQIAFDVMNPFAVRGAARQLKDEAGAAIHKWAVGNLREVDQMNPKLRRMESTSLLAVPYIRLLPSIYRLIYGFMALIPTFRNMLRLCRYEF